MQCERRRESHPALPFTEAIITGGIITIIITIIIFL